MASDTDFKWDLDTQLIVSRVLKWVFGLIFLSGLFIMPDCDVSDASTNPDCVPNPDGGGYVASDDSGMLGAIGMFGWVAAWWWRRKLLAKREIEKATEAVLSQKEEAKVYAEQQRQKRIEAERSRADVDERRIKREEEIDEERTRIAELKLRKEIQALEDELND